MTTPIHPREWETLSAYLDNELNAKESNLLEARVQADSELRNALESLRNTREFLRSLPVQRAPRNFTLTAEMAGILARKRTSSTVFSTMRLAAVLATIFLVVLSAGNLLVNRMQPVQMSQAYLAQQPALGIGGGGGSGGGAESPQNPAVPVEKQGELLSTPEASSSMAEALPVTPLPNVSDSQSNTPGPSESLGMAVPPQEPGPIPEISEPESAQPAPSQAAENLRPGISLITMIQIILATLAVFTGIIAFSIRRSQR
jgi:hypothetical protein